MATIPERAPLQRVRIISTAREMVVAGGLEGLSLRRVAAKLGVTAPALYGHVADKADLLRAIAEGEFERLAERFDAVEATDPVERVRATSRAYVAYARENPALFKVMFLFPPSLGGIENVPPDVELPGATRTFASASRDVQDAIDSGAIKAKDALLVSLALWSAVHGVATVLQMGFGLPPELEDLLVDEVVERTLAGYGA